MRNILKELIPIFFAILLAVGLVGIYYGVEDFVMWLNWK